MIAIVAAVTDNLVNPDWDKGRQYSLPWQSGMTGIGFNRKEAGDITSFKQLFDPKFKGRVTMLSEAYDSANTVLLGDGVDASKATDQFRAFAEQGVEQSREAYAKFKASAETTQKALETAFETAVAEFDGEIPDLEGLREEGFLKDRIKLDPQLLMDYLSPFVDPTLVERFRFSRTWMREQFQRINNPKDPAYTVSIKLNLPPSYVLIHRTWLGGVGVLSQLEAEAPFRALLEEFLPGFSPAVIRPVE